VLNTDMPRLVFNLELDIRRTNWMVNKIRRNGTYAQNFYAALCNNSYQPQDVWGILKNIQWNCSWRYAADLITEIREGADYYYCSGTESYPGYVEESFVTPEVENDIKHIGWVLITHRSFDI
jgi:hypothetical protein